MQANAPATASDVFPVVPSAPQTSSNARSKLAVEDVPIDQVFPDPRNPREHSKGQVRQISESIKKFGFLVPVLIDRGGRLIAGHGRLLACQRLARTTIPAIRVEHLTPAELQAYRIADNRLAENATWNPKLLAEVFVDLQALDLDFSLEITGFELPEIDLRIEQLHASQLPEEPPVEQPRSVAVSRVGDLWQLGRHRLLCGNALIEHDYRTVLDGAVADIVFTDPPYNVPISGHVSGNGQIQHREFAMASGEMTSLAFTAFLTQSFTLMLRSSRSGAILFAFMDWRHLGEVLAAGADVGAELKNVCVWAKDSAGMGSLYRSQHELVLVFKHGNAPHINNVQLGRYGRSRSNVWRYPGVNSFARSTDEGNLLEIHPTVKPVALIADALVDCSHRKDIVLDPFLGSGSTLMAAERVGRRCYGIELDPLYVDVAIRRWQKYSGGEAVHVQTGLTFNARQACLEEGGHGA